MLHTYCRKQLNVLSNLSYATTQICSCMCCMQLDLSCKPKFLVVQAIKEKHKEKYLAALYVFGLKDKSCGKKNSIK